jgi:quercetin dioxygenase-like cupin family protein
MANRIIQWAALAGITMLMSEMSASAADKGSILMKQQLADIAGKEVTVLTVNCAPGALSELHVHPESVVAYVLEGWWSLN